MSPKSDDFEPLVVPPKIAAAMLSVSLFTINAMMKRGELVSYLDGRSRRITVASIKQHVARHLAHADADRPGQKVAGKHLLARRWRPVKTAPTTRTKLIED